MQGGVSDDGRFVVFWSDDPVLNSSSSSTHTQVYVKDMIKNTVTHISPSTSGGVSNNSNTNASISCDGRFVAFESYASDLVSSDTNSASDIFLVDRVGGDLVKDATISGNYDSHIPNISCDGKFIGFLSSATNLVGGDTNGVSDSFVYDILGNSFDRVNVDSSGNQSSFAGSSPSVSDGGQFVAFSSSATDLVTANTNSKQQVYFRDRNAGTTEVISTEDYTTFCPGDAFRSHCDGNNDSDAPVISGNGKKVIFYSRAGSLMGSVTIGNLWNTYAANTGSSTCTP